MVTFSPHPLLLAKEREVIDAPILDGETITCYLDRIGLLKRMGRAPFALVIDGHRVPRALWSGCRPKHVARSINVVALALGGGGKKNPITTIAMLALAYYAGPWAESLAGAGASASTVALYKGAIMVAGGMVIAADFPPPRPGSC